MTDDDTINDFDAAQIAAGWHSVNTWNDPGVAMYSVTSTGRVHSEEHRANLLAYIESCMDAARHLDERGESPILTDEPWCHQTNVEDLEALRDWATCYRIGKES